MYRHHLPRDAAFADIEINPEFSGSKGTVTIKITEEFTKLLKTIAERWNEGNAKKAADRYTEDAIYTERQTSKCTWAGQRFR